MCPLIMGVFPMAEGRRSKQSFQSRTAVASPVHRGIDGGMRTRKCGSVIVSGNLFGESLVSFWKARVGLTEGCSPRIDGPAGGRPMQEKAERPYRPPEDRRRRKGRLVCEGSVGRRIGGDSGFERRESIWTFKRPNRGQRAARGAVG